MILADVQLDAEVWHLVRLVIALLQPLLVLVLIVGLVFATGHLLTMIVTRWGDHRVTSKSMFFSVAMHLLLVGSLIAMIPEYRAAEILNLASQELEPIRVTVPLGNTRNPTETGTEAPGFELSTTTFGNLPTSTSADRERSAGEAAPVPESMPLPKPNDTPAPELAATPDRAQELEIATPTPEQVKPADTPAESSASMLTAEPAMQALPQQANPGEGVLAKTERSALPAAAQGMAEALSRPDRGTSDRSVAALTPDRQSTESMVLPSEDAALRTPDLMTSRNDLPAPIGPTTPKLLGQSSPAETPLTPNPQQGRMEARPTGPVNSPTGMGIGRVRPRGTGTETGPSVTPDSGLAMAIPSERPELSRVENPFQPQAGGSRLPSAYRLRSDEERGKAVMKFGGSQETEDAVDRSLNWMASVQNPAGYWHAGVYGDDATTVPTGGGADQQPDVGTTALAVLAFLGKQNTVDEGAYSPVVNRALKWIVAQQQVRHWGEGWGSSDGYLGAEASEFEAMYCHAMATFALAEAYAMSRKSPEAQWLREPLEKAVRFILDTQNVDGGWRYVKGQREGDMSIFGWQLMALKSAQASGIRIDERRLQMMQRFLNERRIGSSGGLAGFRPREGASASAAAETLFCRQMLGMTNDPVADEESVRVILANLPRGTTLNYYYWYYGTLAIYQHGGAEWEQWNTAMRNMLVAAQRRTGPMAGSWDPQDVWGSYGGRMYSTAIATLSLEVYYRYLPIYRLNEVLPE